jgi:hypothetical protein
MGSGMPIRFGVAVHNPKKRIRIRVAGIERVRRIAIKCECTVEKSRTGGIARAALDEDAEFQAVRADDVREVIGIVPDVICAKEREPLLDIQRTNVVDAACKGSMADWVNGSTVCLARFTPNVNSFTFVGLNV